MDRNILSAFDVLAVSASLSARRAWIEIANFCRNRFCPTVALRKESVDRNLGALWALSTQIKVALRKESVDRNQRIAKPFREQFKSLSARRAWIEIQVGSGQRHLLDSRSPQGERG